MRNLIRCSVASLVFVCWVSCSDDEEFPNDEGGGPLHTGEACVVADDCFDGFAADIEGEIQCLDRVEDGYCTHLCADDGDCCAVPGECDDGEVQVCGPFESTGMMMCFISCEDDALDGEDAEVYCDRYHPDFHCRSTGGGSENRKVCVPEG